MEGKNPLAAFHRATKRSCATLSNSQAIPYSIFRYGWNTFARNLDISYNSSFQCSECGPEPEIVICDGTFLGMRKDLIHPFMPKPQTTTEEPIRGTTLTDRVVIPNSKTRKLLQIYSGKCVTKSTRGFRKVSQSKEMTRAQLKELLTNLETESPELCSLIKRLTNETKSRISPDAFQTLFYELSLTSPAVGLLQIGGDEYVFDLIRRVANNTLSLFESSAPEHLTYLKDRTPILCNFLSKIKTPDGYIPRDVGQVVLIILTKIEKCFSRDDENSYPAIFEDKLSFFPTLPQRHGYGYYEADKKSTSDTTNCRKDSYKHPKLTPGIFTIFCPHGICYGFQAMTSCESPKVPFNIFKTRFTKAPSVIIYDNACNLHKYCLNREPVYFKRTRFYVDSFHWKGHIACSEGYCIELHKSTINTVLINSQINEQANAGLKRLQSQLTYMSAPNFMFHIALYLSLKNKDKLSLLKGPSQMDDKFEDLCL